MSTLSTSELSSNLFPENHAVPCRDSLNCGASVVEFEGRFFITFGHGGFNSPANNRLGYGSRSKALAAVCRYENRGARR